MTIFRAMPLKSGMYMINFQFFQSMQFKSKKEIWACWLGFEVKIILFCKFLEKRIEIGSATYPIPS
jgi:hypothetical protein